jgi:hypothetical protein
MRLSYISGNVNSSNKFLKNYSQLEKWSNCWSKARSKLILKETEIREGLYEQGCVRVHLQISK